MSIAQEVDEKMKQAMIDKNELELSVYRLIKSAVKNMEIEKGKELSDEDVVLVLEKQAKQRRDSIEQYEKGERTDLADKEKSELSIIEAFLPEKMGEDEIRKIVKEKTATMSGAQFGQIMGSVMAELKGKADGGTVQKIVKEEIEKSS